MTDHLQLSPSELRFRFELRRNIPVTLSLHNPGKETVAFKVKTTSPKKYCVRPSSGIVEPGSTKDVQVIMQAQREYPPSLADCKDKFLVQTCTVSSDVKEASPDVFESKSAGDIKHTKLRVVLLGPAKPPSPVPEGIEEDMASPAKDTSGHNAYEPAATRPPPGVSSGVSNHTSNHSPELSSQDVIALMQERNKLQDQLKQARSDNSSIRDKLDLLELQSRGATPVTQQAVSRGGFKLLYVIIIAILAFVLGWYL